MSRIRDALRRAEQEKGRAPAPSSTEALTPPAVPASASRSAPGGTTPCSPAAAIAAAYASSSVPVAQPLRAVSASSAALLEICRRPLWHGDSSELLFLGGARRTIATEQLRNLRSQLTEMRTRRTLKSVVISSSSPSEGKTFVAANLAYAFARQHDRRILLLDADLRRSRLPTLLGAPAEPGLNEYLRGAATEEQILQRSPQENLFFIPGGKPAANPGDLLAGGKLKKLLEQLTPLFDWILVDTPAGGEIPDARLVADCCDGVLLVIQTGVTPRKAAQLAAREFPRDRLLGVVLNQAAVR